MPTKLDFDKDHSLVVDEDLTTVESAMRTAPPGVAGLVKFTVDGADTFINAALVRAFSAYVEPRPPVSGPSPFD